MQTSASLPAGERVTYQAGATIIREGEPGELMYIILSGMVAVIAHGITIATLGPGTVVGEMAFIDGSPRSASVIAQTNCALAPIDQPSFAWLIGHDPGFATQLMRSMAGRMRLMTAHILAPAAEQEPAPAAQTRPFPAKAML